MEALPLANNLVFHFQTVIHNVKDGIYLHEAFSSRDGTLYSVNPVPVEVYGDTEEEIEESLRAMETDSTRYKPVKIDNLNREMLRWSDEVAVTTVPEYEDEEDLEENYYGTDGEVLDCLEYFKRNK